MYKSINQIGKGITFIENINEALRQDFVLLNNYLKLIGADLNCNETFQPLPTERVESVIPTLRINTD